MMYASEQHSHLLLYGLCIASCRLDTREGLYRITCLSKLLPADLKQQQSPSMGKGISWYPLGMQTSKSLNYFLERLITFFISHPSSPSGETADVNHIADKLAKLVTSRSQESPSDVSFKIVYHAPCQEQDDSDPTEGSEGEEHGKGEEFHAHRQYVRLGLHTEAFSLDMVKHLGLLP